MYDVLCDFVGNTVHFFILLSFFCRLSHKPLHLCPAFGCLVLWFLGTRFLTLPLFEFLFALFLLLLYGIFCSHVAWRQSALISILLLSVSDWSTGLTKTVGHWLAEEIGSSHVGILQILDLSMALFSCGLLYLFLLAVSQLFCCQPQYLYHQILVAVTCPFLFVVLLERILMASLYGDTIIWGYTGGLLYPQIQTAPIFMLQLLAGMTFLSILLLFRRLEQTISLAEENKFLVHQTAEQAMYIQEIQSRKKEFCSLQHDIKNHFLLLQELLRQQKLEEASNYLSNLEALSHQIDYPIQTGNATVDILLKNKLAVIQQKGAEIQCGLRIPSVSAVSDMEWCIIFGNAVDNASQAVEAVPPERRYLHIHGRQQGNFLYLQVENACAESQSSIVEGIGLYNIRTVLQKHSGTLDLEVAEGKFTLNLLLLISQP